MARYLKNKNETWKINKQNVLSLTNSKILCVYLLYVLPHVLGTHECQWVPGGRWAFKGLDTDSPGLRGAIDQL